MLSSKQYNSREGEINHRILRVSNPTMVFMRGEPLVAKLAVLAKYVVLPGAMAAAVIYSPPGYASYYNPTKYEKSSK
uniref:Uncharacterized protein n=2 Tax=Fagaceae TaxID=3503 RepID=A0A7N2M7F2_QUELO